MEKLNAEVFLKVVETGSFKKAADVLNYTQAGVSYIINAIKGLSSGTVRVSTFNSVYIRWLPGILRSFEEKHPGIKVEVISCEDNTENERMIFSREVDCGFLVGKVSLEIDSFDLAEDALMAAVLLLI